MKAKKIIIGLVLLGFIAITSSMDYEDELEAERHYCQMVKDGNWPAFNEGVNCNKTSK